MTTPARSPVAAEAVRDIVVEEVLPHRPEKVWHALTSSDLIARWLMPNDFEPVLGKRFTFRTDPMGSWDGVIHCQVLEIVPPKRIVYSWKGGAADNPKYGSLLDTTATWTLEPVGQGTRIKLVHAGFRTPANDHAYQAMSSGWGKVIQRISEIAAD